VIVAFVSGAVGGDTFRPLPKDIGMNLYEFSFQLDYGEQAGMLCTPDWYCLYWEQDVNNCYYFVDSDDATYYECYDQNMVHVSGATTYDDGYTIQYKAVKGGYYYWDNSGGQWYTSFDSRHGYTVQYLDSGEIYYSEWSVDAETGTYRYWNSAGEQVVEFASGTYYEFFASGDIYYFAAEEDAYYYFDAIAGTWYIWEDATQSYEPMEGEPVFYGEEEEDDISEYTVIVNETALAKLIEDIHSF